MKRPEPGDTTTHAVVMGSNYQNQIWFDLGTETIVKTGLRMDWDIALDSDAGENHIYVNASRLMKAAKSTQSFDQTTSANGLTFLADYNTLNPDSLAFSGWQVNDVYVVDLGYNEAGNGLGNIKLQITAFVDGVLSFRYAPLTGGTTIEGQMTKNSDFNSVSYSLLNHSALIVEPPKTDWDLVFTQYTYIFYEPGYTPYLVTGVLGNSNGVEVAIDKTKDFAAITYDDVATYTFSSLPDVIGYDWKAYNFDLASYTIYSNINYIVKDVAGVYYKLHFIDFYDDNGLKGAPKFEMQRL